MSTSPAADQRRHPLIILTVAGLSLATLMASLAAWPYLHWPHHVQAIVEVRQPTWVDITIAALIVVALAAAAVLTNRPTWRRWTGRTVAGLAVLAVSATLMGASEPAHQITLPALTADRHALDYRAITLSAVHSLMEDYHWSGGSDGRWMSSWWTTALETDAVIQAEHATGDRTYLPAIEHTFATNAHYADGESEKFVPFGNHYADDSAWWGLTWLDAYRFTNEVKFRQAAELLDNYVAGFWSPSCGGGIQWAQPTIKDGWQKNAITNTTYLALSAGLYRVTRDPLYLHRALAEWQWLKVSNLVRTDGLLADHLTDDCRPTGAVWSYNQGPILSGLATMTAATGDWSYASIAEWLAASSTSSPLLVRGGVLRDPCEAEGCRGDAEAFKGPMVAGVASLDEVLPGRPFAAWLSRQAASVYAHDRMAGDLYGLSWSGPPDTTSPTRQASAISLFTATLGGNR